MLKQQFDSPCFSVGNNILPKQLNRYLLWVMLLLSLAASIWVSMAEESSDATFQASKPHTKFSPGIQSQKLGAEGQATEILTRGKIEDDPIDLFQPHITLSTEAAAEETPQQPNVPDLPYKYAGKLAEGESLILFLTNENNNRNYAVHKGDVIDRIWRVDEISPSQITFIHLPSKTVMLLPIGDNN